MALAQLTYMPTAAAVEPAHARARRLMAEAKEAADEQVLLLERALAVVAELSADVAEGGEVYPPGVRDISKKLAADAVWCAQTLGQIMAQTAVRRPPPPAPV